MSASAKPPVSLCQFNPDELDQLAKTADAMSAYLGQPVLAEVIVNEEGTEWVAFGVALDQAAEIDDEQPLLQMGGPDSRLLGGRGGLSDSSTEAYECLYLWGVQISLTEGERFVKIDQDGEESAWSDTLRDVLPFELGEALDEDEADEDEDDEDDEDIIDTRPRH